MEYSGFAYMVEKYTTHLLVNSIQREGWIKREGWIEYTKGRIDKEKRMESVQWEDESREKDR